VLCKKARSCDSNDGKTVTSENSRESRFTAFRRGNTLLSRSRQRFSERDQRRTFDQRTVEDVVTGSAVKKRVRRVSWSCCVHQWSHSTRDTRRRDCDSQAMILGLDPSSVTLLVLTLLLSTLTFSGPRTTVLEGSVHLVLFLVYIILIFSP
jgi:hypothetical protein